MLLRFPVEGRVGYFGGRVWCFEGRGVFADRAFGIVVEGLLLRAAWICIEAAWGILEGRVGMWAAWVLLRATGFCRCGMLLRAAWGTVGAAWGLLLRATWYVLLRPLELLLGGRA